MPYKDPERKKQWEFQHRAHRLSRRRHLRQIEAAQKEQHFATPVENTAESGVSWVAFAGSAALAIYSPKLATGIGALILISYSL